MLPQVRATAVGLLQGRGLFAQGRPPTPRLKGARFGAAMMQSVRARDGPGAEAQAAAMKYALGIPARAVCRLLWPPCCHLLSPIDLIPDSSRCGQPTTS